MKPTILMFVIILMVNLLAPSCRVDHDAINGDLDDILLSPGNDGPESRLLFRYTGDDLPSADGWTIVNYTNYESTGAHVENGILHFTDNSTAVGSAIQYIHDWPTAPGKINVAQFEVKITSVGGGGNLLPGLHGIYIGISDGDSHMAYTLYPDRIQSSYFTEGRLLVLGAVYDFDTTGQFNTYTAVIVDGIALLYINGELALKQPGGVGTYNQYITGVEFGAGSSQATGVAEFNEIRTYQRPEDIISTTLRKFE